MNWWIDEWAPTSWHFEWLTRWLVTTSTWIARNQYYIVNFHCERFDGDILLFQLSGIKSMVVDVCILAAQAKKYTSKRKQCANVFVCDGMQINSTINSHDARMCMHTFICVAENENTNSVYAPATSIWSEHFYQTRFSKCFTAMASSEFAFDLKSHTHIVFTLSLLCCVNSLHYFMVGGKQWLWQRQHQFYDNISFNSLPMQSQNWNAFKFKC